MQPQLFQPFRFVALIAVCCSQSLGVYAKVPDFLTETGDGTVTKVEHGVVYRSGMPFQIVRIRSGSKQVAILAPTMTMQPIIVGEKLSYEGLKFNVNGFGDVIDTSKYYLVRKDEKTMQEASAEMMAQMTNASKGDPSASAIPSYIVQSNDQMKQSEKDRADTAARDWTAISISVLSLVIALANAQKIIELLLKIYSVSMTFVLEKTTNLLRKKSDLEEPENYADV